MTNDELLADRIAKGGFISGVTDRFDAPAKDRDTWKSLVLKAVGEAVAKAEADILAERPSRCNAHRFAGSGGSQHAPLNLVCTCDEPVRKSAVAFRAAGSLSKLDAETVRVARELGLPLDATFIESILNGPDDVE